MNPIITILLAAVFSLCVVLIAGAGLMHTSWKRRRAIALGRRDIHRGILTIAADRGVVVDFVRHSPELSDVLAVLATADKPRSFARVVPRFASHGQILRPMNVATHLVGATLGILLWGFDRVIEKDRGNEGRREVQRRLTQARLRAAWQTQPDSGDGNDNTKETTNGQP